MMVREVLFFKEVDEGGEKSRNYKGFSWVLYFKGDGGEVISLCKTQSVEFYYIS